MWKEKYDEWLKRPKCESFFGGGGRIFGCKRAKKRGQTPKVAQRRHL